MSRLHLAIAVLFGTLLSAMIYISSQAQETTIVTAPTAATDTTTTTAVATVTPNGNVIVTPVPAPKEVVVTPQGYVNCFTVDAGWNGDLWVPAHRVCQYNNTDPSVQGVAWVEGYWACNTYTNQQCTNWVWKPGRWVKTLEVY